MVRCRLKAGLFCLTCGLVLVVSSGLSACSPRNNGDSTPPVTAAQRTPPPTPDSELLQVSDTRPTGPRLHVTFPSITLLNHDPTRAAQLFLVLADPQGGFSYMLYPANSPGYPTTQFDLRSNPLELSINDDTIQLVLWILAVHNTRYEAAEVFGLDTLIASLGIGFQRWLNQGNPADDPLAAVVSASEGVLYEWFAEIEVIGQSVIMLDAADDWDADFLSERSPDGGLNSVYTVQYISEPSVSALTTPAPTPPASTQDDNQFELLVDESFEGGESAYTWYEGGDSTYENTIIDGAYQIQLTDITQRQFGLSWGSLEGERFENYVLAAEVSLVEEDVDEAYYGVWFHYQDGRNFVYFGVSNGGEYRVAVVQDNTNVLEIRDWTPHSAVSRGAASNLLTVEARADGIFILAINHEQVLTFTDHTYTGGSIAFFCRARSVPATCQLNRLRIWTRDS